MATKIGQKVPMVKKVGQNVPKLILILYFMKFRHNLGYLNEIVLECVFILIYLLFQKNRFKNEVFPTVFLKNYIYLLVFDDLLCGNNQTIAMIVSLELLFGI